MGKKSLELKEVTGALLSHETRRKPINDQANKLVVRSEIRSLSLSHNWQMIENFDQMQEM
jgi:hypothetical protein